MIVLIRAGALDLLVMMGLVYSIVSLHITGHRLTARFHKWLFRERG